MEVHLTSFYKKLDNGAEVKITLVHVDEKFFAAKWIDTKDVTDTNEYGKYVPYEKGDILKYTDNVRLRADLYPAYGMKLLKSEL